MILTQLYIDGQWQSPIDQGTRAILSPADESVIAQAAEATRADARLAIAAARKAFDGPWRQTTIRDRARLLNKIAELIDRDAEKLARLESLNTGKTLTESRTDMGDIAATFRYFAGLVASESGAVNEAPHHVISRTLREPVGVCGLITPWNYPLLQAAWKIAPALGAGNTVVIKPSNLTPLTTHHFTQLVAELDLPPGVFNLVTGGAEVGAELAESLDVDLVSFTGGAYAGESIMKAATGNFKRIGLELGGKNPNIVFADADLDAAVDYALNAAFFHAGQVCSAGSRLMIEDGIYDAFISRLAERLPRIVIGNGFHGETQMGPVQSAQQHEKILGMVQAGIAEGARLVHGGKRPAGDVFKTGYWLEPTLLADVTADMKIAKEEIFGPVITAERFRSEEEVLRAANDTPYGLAGAVWTRDLDKANRMSRGLRFGTVWVNDYHPYFPEAPWGGYKASGIGRELARIGLDEYTELKHSYINLAPKAMGWFGA
ncbi:Acyl-CoA reductase [Cupriavidus necator]|uniref:Aldehyde dehydrogenase family protein n=1 Tax=Cupriavidus necator (strain ATCC 17699 / DSM 428 / KCTC 22496 / NCIMB 10442 / H16 / Stanier 337) TaxID=381666 RepID=Q0JZB2_CUPNH|nr:MULTISPECIES: aldehyde dehydrogenase family protein [Cupriavidus]EON19858.1 betaine-aldehyde dehydrogenase [Cupriavidus sp. GA3-3]QCC04707.1 aldehyde dehydrogenase family protein [Cupriavidus necator H16]QQB79400.1 aldehyde dehydrogenase family protein [Cupriavidus necator]WKA43629.1 aldehyde dehydrogenase family protein [Cupriavidus necator]CAJ96912.1 Betaine-aldehyde dehydrogenase [Cupriavidus necator H16]